MGCFHPCDAQALFSPIHHFPSQIGPSSHFVQRIVFYQSFQFSLASCVLRFTELLA